MRLAVLTVVALHAIVLVAHDWAHRSLGVGLVLRQLLFAYSVIVAAPVVAAAAVFTQNDTQPA